MIFELEDRVLLRLLSSFHNNYGINMMHFLDDSDINGDVTAGKKIWVKIMVMDSDIFNHVITSPGVSIHTVATAVGKAAQNCK